MNVSCPECRSVFRIDPAKVPGAGVHARCSICGAVIVIAAVTTSVPQVPAESREPDSALIGRPAPVPELASPELVSRPMHAVAAEPVVPEPVAPEFAAPELVATSEARARPVNPYLNNTPELRARRLARALVSDLVAYNPQKREQGLRDGTLRQLFREEIRKSWDEYVGQVGAGVAESTPHFQDALNDVLAGGRRVF